MANPKKKMSRTRSGNRRSHDALKASALSKCKSCGATKRPHFACRACEK